MASKIFNILPLIVLLIIVQLELGSIGNSSNWHDAQNLVTFFVAILLEAMPFVLIGSLISGILETVVPQEKIASFLPRNRFLAVAVFGLMGIIFPMCECGIVPVIRRLLRKGVPLSCGITYLLAAPIVQPLVLAATFVAFNGSWKMAGLRLLGGYLVAVSVGMLSALVLDPRAAEHIAFDMGNVAAGGHAHDGCGHDHDHDHDRVHVNPAPVAARAYALNLSVSGNTMVAAAVHSAGCLSLTGGGCSCGVEPVASGGNGRAAGISLPVAHNHDHDGGHAHADANSGFIPKLQSVLVNAKSDFLSTGYYLIFGALLAATMQTFVGQGVLVHIGHGAVMGILVMMALAFTMSLCSAADAFVAAAFTQFTRTSLLAFLVMGPMVDIKLLAMYNGFLSKKATAFVFGLATLFAFVFAITLHIIGMDRILR